MTDPIDGCSVDPYPLWDEILEQIRSGCPRDGLLNLVLGLQRHRTRLGEAEWLDYIEAANRHPLRGVLHEDPFTARSYRKPRGYAGDPELIDFIYDRRPPAGHAVSSLGRLIFEWSTNLQASVAVRNRLRLLSRYIDRAIEGSPDPAILSVAAGHLREARGSRAIREKGVGRFVAFDQDVLNLEVIRRDYADLGVTTEQGKIRDLMAGDTGLGEFDLAYSAGVYDYFKQNTAVRMTRVLFDHLKPGGKLLVANFLPGIRDAGYMECFMGWHLTYRSDAEMEELIEEIPPHALGSRRQFHDEAGQITFLELTRAA